jgi:DNA-binding GntR family transcriptional regulator
VPEALADRAYYAIRELIVSLDLRPGSVVNERELMERLDLGRTPIREAVRRLAQEQLVEVFPRRGTFVTNVEIRDLASICEVRSSLESHAARITAIGESRLRQRCSYVKAGLVFSVWKTTRMRVRWRQRIGSQLSAAGTLSTRMSN